MGRHVPIDPARGIVPPYVPGRIYAAPGQVGNNDTTAAGQMWASPFLLRPGRQVLVGLYAEVTANVSTKFRIGLKFDNGAGGPGRLIKDAGVYLWPLGSGTVRATFAPIVLDTALTGTLVHIIAVADAAGFKTVDPDYMSAAITPQPDVGWLMGKSPQFASPSIYTNNIDPDAPFTDDFPVAIAPGRGLLKAGLIFG